MFFADSAALFNLPSMPPLRHAGAVLDLAVMASVPPTAATLNQVFQIHNLNRRVLESQFPEVEIAIRSGQIGAADPNQTKVVLSLPSPPPDLAAPAALFHAGIRVTGLVYGRANLFGGGYGQPRQPLSAAGRLYVRNCLQAGLVIDLANAGRDTALDTLSYLAAEAPSRGVMASQIGCHAVYPHPRNLQTEVMGAIAASGGFVGISLEPFLLHASDDTLKPFMDHLHFALYTCGTDCVGIGSGIVYRQVSDDNAASTRRYLVAITDEPEPRFQPRLPLQPLVLNRADWMAVLADELQREFGPALAAMIAGGNLRNFLARSLPQ